VSATAAAVLASAAGGLLLLLTTHLRGGPGVDTAPVAAEGRGVLPSARPQSASLGAPMAGMGETVLGRVAPTEWGDVQVRLTIRGHRIVAAQAVEHPHAGAQSRRINDRALPILYRETVTAQSARIDSVSGATITSTGYRQSLQSAIDQSHLTGGPSLHSSQGDAGSPPRRHAVVGPSAAR